MYLSTEGAARLFGFHEATLAKWRVKGGGPLFHRVGRSIRYDEAELERWMRERSYENTSQYGRS
jgi:excisionase family DNA binding protein